MQFSPSSPCPNGHLGICHVANTWHGGMLKTLIEKVDFLSANFEKLAASLAVIPPATRPSFSSLLKTPSPSVTSLLKEHTNLRTLERAEAAEAAEARPVPLCRDFASKRGCTRGVCNYLHQVPDCKDFKRGKCARGPNCRFLHRTQTQTQSQARAQTQVQTQPQPQPQRLQPPGLHPVPNSRSATAAPTRGPVHSTLAAPSATPSVTPTVTPAAVVSPDKVIADGTPAATMRADTDALSPTLSGFNDLPSSSSRRGSLAKRHLGSDAEKGELRPKHRRVGTSSTLAAASCPRECGFTASSTEDMCRHANVVHTNELPPDSDPHLLAHSVNAMIETRCPDGLTARFCDRCRTFFADCASALEDHSSTCEGSSTHLARTGVDPRFGTFQGGLPLAAAGLILEELEVTSTEREAATIFALPGFPALVRQEVGSVVELDGKTERQFCFPLAVLRSHPVGVAAADSLPPGCSTDARLKAFRTALSAQAVGLRRGLVQLANVIASQARGRAFDFATPGSGADVEMVHACAMLVCPLVTVHELEPGRFSAVRISHPSRPATPDFPTAVLFCEMKPAKGAKPARYHFQALVQPVNGAASVCAAPTAPVSPTAASA